MDKILRKILMKVLGLQIQKSGELEPISLDTCRRETLVLIPYIWRVGVT